jgi:hypothetical protein
VELALTLPVLVTVVLGVLQVVVVARDHLALGLAAREAARAAAVAAAPAAAATDAAHAATTLRPLEIDTRVGADTVTVTVRTTTVTRVPILGPLLDDVDHQATATMALEPIP